MRENASLVIRCKRSFISDAKQTRFGGFFLSH
nr:MAG TPA: hypothetical protein [Caudoviricetes sp.]